MNKDKYIYIKDFDNKLHRTYIEHNDTWIDFFDRISKNILNVKKNNNNSHYNHGYFKLYAPYQKNKDDNHLTGTILKCDSDGTPFNILIDNSFCKILPNMNLGHHCNCFFL